MAYPKDSGDFEATITDRIDFFMLPPKSGDTGDFEQTLTHRIDFIEYVEAVAEAPPGLVWPIFFDEIHSAMFGGQVVR